MNPNELLTRFASASQWLAEEHPDAPRLLGCYDLLDGTIEQVGCSSLDERGCVIFIDNPSACLTGAVVWAMEVADSFSARQMGWCEVKSNPLAVERERFGNMRWEVFIFDHERNIDYSGNGNADTPTEAWASVIESICTALGREG